MRTGHVRTRAEFTALRTRGVRSRHRPVRVTYLAPTDGTDQVRVAFAIGRPVGTAVRRNRLRRRLRAALGELAPNAGTYLVGANADAAQLPYDTLRDQLAAALAEVGARAVP